MEPNIGELQSQIETTKEPSKKIKLLNTLALEIQFSDSAKSVGLLKEAISIGESNSSSTQPLNTELSVTWSNLSGFHRDNGKYSEAIKAISISLELAESSGDEKMITDRLTSFGVLHGFNSDYDAAMRYFFRALNIGRTRGDLIGVADILNNIGYTLVLLGKIEEALPFLNESLEIFEKFNESASLLVTLDSISNAYLGLGKYEKALDYGLRSIEIRGGTIKPGEEVDSLLSLAKVYIAQEKYKEALIYSQDALEISTENNLPREISVSSRMIGEIYTQIGQYAKAINCLNRSFKGAVELGAKQIILECHLAYSIYYEKIEDFKEAYLHTNQYHILKDEIDRQQAVNRYRSYETSQIVKEAKKDAKIYQDNIRSLQREVERSLALQVQLHELAITDTLTGLYNRGHFFNLAEIEFETAIQSNDPISVIMIDIDHFKEINDQFGHRAGDQVLSISAKRIQSGLRDKDIVGRYGGEEFVVILTNTGLVEARETAERLRNSMESEPISTDKINTLVKVSAGVASAPADNKISLDELLDQADQALYHAKNEGRNLVRTFQDKHNIQ